MATFLIADTHFGHANMLKFVNYDGTPVRPFSSVEEMDETMVDNWNRVVMPSDKVYHLGDVAIAKKGIAIMARLNGSKVLIRGNHDIFKLRDYAPYFKDIRGSHKLDNFVLSHIPLHPDAITNAWCEGNIHGHMHNNQIRSIDNTVNRRYLNVSVERINYTPIEISEAFNMIRRPA